MTSQPTAWSAAVAAAANMGPEVRASRARTTRGRSPSQSSRRYAPNAAAKRETTSGVSSAPTRPRMPDTLTIKPGGISNAIAGIQAQKRKRAACPSNAVRGRHTVWKLEKRGWMSTRGGPAARARRRGSRRAAASEPAHQQLDHALGVVRVEPVAAGEAMQVDAPRAEADLLDPRARVLAQHAGLDGLHDVDVRGARRVLQHVPEVGAEEVAEQRLDAVEVEAPAVLAVRGGEVRRH